MNPDEREAEFLRFARDRMAEGSLSINSWHMFIQLQTATKWSIYVTQDADQAYHGAMLLARSLRLMGWLAPANLVVPPPGWYDDPLYGQKADCWRYGSFKDMRQVMIVLKPWMFDMTLQMQGTLLGAVRGPDGAVKQDPAKILVRAFRAVIINNAKPLGPENMFQGDGSGRTEQADVDAFFSSLDQYNAHWLTHFMFAAEIIGYMHEDKILRAYWLGIYFGIVGYFHLMPESQMEMMTRLKANGVDE